MIEQKLPFVIMKFEGDQRLVDTFEFAIKPAVQTVLGLSDEELLKIRIDEAISYQHDLSTPLPSVSEKILEAISDSLFVICDTTGNRPNCYFELGYALAHKKHIFLLHRRDAEKPHFDIVGRPIIYYSGALELRQELQTRISHHFGIRSSRINEQISDFWSRCGLPIITLEGDARYPYRISQIGERAILVDLVDNRKFMPHAPWRERFNVTLAKQLEIARDRGDVLFNGDLVRLRDYHPQRDERTNARFIRLDVEPTDYFTFISSNYSRELLDRSYVDELMSIESVNAHNMKLSTLANPLTVCICVIVEYEGKEWVLIQERNIDKNFHCKQKFQCSAAGMVSLSRDLRPHGIDVFSTAKNELEEELGIPFREDQISFLGLLRETRNYEVTLVGEVSITADPNRILKPSADSFEVIQVFACELTPERYAEFITRHGGIDNFTLLGVGATVYSLLRRFPTDRVEGCMRLLRRSSEHLLKPQ